MHRGQDAYHHSFPIAAIWACEALLYFTPPHVVELGDYFDCLRIIDNLHNLGLVYTFLHVLERCCPVESRRYCLYSVVFYLFVSLSPILGMGCE